MYAFMMYLSFLASVCLYNIEGIDLYELGVLTVYTLLLLVGMMMMIIIIIIIIVLMG
jgi:hypothetical protein